MKQQKMMTCKSCGAELEQGEKVCSACGKTCGKPFYKKVWFWGLVVVLCAAAGIGGSSDTALDKPAEPTTDTPAVTVPVVTEIELSSVFDMSGAEIKEVFGEPTIEKWEDGASFTYSFHIGLYVNRLEVNGELCENEIFYTKGGASQEPRTPLKLHGISFDMTAAEVKEELGEPLLKQRMEGADPAMGLDSYFLYYVNDQQEVCVFFDDETGKVSGISSMFADLMPPMATDPRDLSGYVGTYTTKEEIEDLFTVVTAGEWSPEEGYTGGWRIKTTAALFYIYPDGSICHVSPISNYFHVCGLRLGDNIHNVDLGYSFTELDANFSTGEITYMFDDGWSTQCELDVAFNTKSGAITTLSARNIQW